MPCRTEYFCGLLAIKNEAGYICRGLSDDGT